MSKQTIKDKILTIRNERRTKANTKVRVADVLTDINESKVEVDEIPTKTSDLINNGADGIHPFITAQSVMTGYVPLEGTTEPITGDLEFRGYDSGMFKENAIASLKVWMEDDGGNVRQNFNYTDKTNPTVKYQISIEPFTGGIDANKYFGPGSETNFVQRKYVDDTTLPQPEDDGEYIISKVGSDILFVETATKTSDFTNDGDGVSPFVTLADIPDTDISGKLDKPTTDGSWVITKIGNQITYTSANNFGQNIANSQLTSIAGSGMILGAPYTWNTGGQPFYLTNLPDKSSDNTFTKFKVQSSSGQEAVVNNPFEVLKSGLTTMTVAQALELGQLLNGGAGSEGAMSVNLISPPVIEKIDSNEYILLRGANLNLNATSKKIEILDAITQAVVATIPDNQIQVYSTGIDLIFYYNFKDISFGNYIIRITSGSKVYITTNEISVVSSVNLLNLDATTWEVMYDSPTSNLGNNVFSGRNINIESPVIATSDDVTRVSVKSNTLFAQGTNFFLEYELTLSANPTASAVQFPQKSYIGIGYANAGIALANNSLVNSSFSYAATAGSQTTYSNVYANGVFAARSPNGQPRTYNVVIIKTGNLFRVIIDGLNTSVTLSNNNAYALFVSVIGRQYAQSLQVQLTKAYTFS